MRRLFSIAVVAVAVTSGACDLDPRGALADDPPPAPPPGEQSPPASPDPSAETGFPCDVRAVLETYCASCHAQIRYYNMQFTTRDDFFIPPGPAGTPGQEAAMRAAMGTRPPSYAAKFPTADGRAILIAWWRRGCRPALAGRSRRRRRLK